MLYIITILLYLLYYNCYIVMITLYFCFKYRIKNNISKKKYLKDNK